MRILLDTHAWLWLLTAPERLRPSARREVESAGNELYLSAASSWEMAIKVGLKKLVLPKKPAVYVPEMLSKYDVKSLQITHAHALQVASLPAHHRDPFDRLLVAQSMLERIPILTSDAKIAKYRVEVLRA